MANDITPIYLTLMMLRILGNELEGKDLYAVTLRDTRQISHLSTLYKLRRSVHWPVDVY
jgi:hypothetical protein